MHPIPNWGTKFPIKLNPLYTEENKKKYYEYTRGYSLLSERKFNEAFSTGLITAYCYHTDDPGRFDVLVLFMITSFIIDDHIDDYEGEIVHDKNECQKIYDQMDEAFQKLLSNKYISMLYWKPYITIYYVWLETMFQQLNDVQKNRIYKIWTNYMNGQVKLTEAFDSIDKTTDIEKLIQLRLNESAAIGNAAVIEYDQDIFITDEVWNSEQFQRLMQIFWRFLTFVNDLYSFEKEVIEHRGDERKIRNLVSFISRCYGLDVEQSMNKVVSMIKELENDFYSVKSDIYNDITCSEVLKKFIESVEYICGGVVHGHLIAQRYKAHSHVEKSSLN